MKYKFNKEYEINKESVDKMAAIKGIDTSKGVAVTDVLDLDLGTSLIDFIWEAEKEAIAALLLKKYEKKTILEEE